MDENTAPAPETAAPEQTQAPEQAATAGQPEFTVPDGQELLSRDEVARMRRAEERVKGMEPFYETARELGFKSVEDLKKYQQTMGVFSQKGLSLEQLAAAMQADAGQPDHGGGDAPVDIDSLRQSIMDELESKSALKEHQTAEQAELEMLQDLKDLGLPENTPPEVVDAIKAAAEGYYWRNRSLYGDDHRLKGHLAPLGREGIDEKVRAPLKQFLSKFQGLQLAEIGEAAARKKASPAAGSPGAGDGNRSNPPEPTNLEEAVRQKFAAAR